MYRSDYTNGHNFSLGVGSQGGSVAGNIHRPHRLIVWPCPTCGGFIINNGYATCGNTKCGGDRTNLSRYLKVQVKTQLCVEEGLYIVYACRPCDLCKHVGTRPSVCHTCSVLSED